MTRQELDKMISKWEKDFNPRAYTNFIGDTQYDDRSALINYCMIREYKPTNVLEFGARFGRCTRDIMQALRDNGKKFKFKSCELDNDLRRTAQASLDNEFGTGAIELGADVLQEELPKNLDYVFVDHSHDEPMSRWVLDTLIPNHCKDGAIIQIHDLPLFGDWEIRENPWNETSMIKDRHLAGTLKLEKIYWTYEEGDRWESTWWKYKA